VLAFASAEEAVRHIAGVREGYPAHCSAAREIARGVFAHDVVLPRLLEAAMSDETRVAAAPAGGVAG
jgi:hypothetical protein